MGSYFADFVCHSAKLVIEVDGGQHGENRTYDAVRTTRMEEGGYQVLRFWNNDVLRNMDGVLEVVRAKLLESGKT